MTTLARTLARLLPRRLVSPALALIYAGLLVAIAFNLGVRNDAAIIYLDIRNN